MWKMLVVLVFCLSFVPKQTLAQSSMLRLDAEPNGVFTFWVAQEMEVGFTVEVLASTVGWSELDLGWAFRPSKDFTILAMTGVSLSGKSLTNVVPILVTFFQKESWYGEWWNVGQIDVGEVEASTWYTRLFMTYYSFGPWIEAVVGNDAQQVWAGGIFVKDFGSFQTQLSAGVNPQDDDFTYRLSVVKLF